MVSDGEHSESEREDSDPDLRLVRRIAEGDPAAFTMLVERHLDRVVRLAERMMGNRAEAEDVAQEVFTRVWQHAKNWQSGKARYSTWLHRVTVNLCQDRLRRRREVDLDQVAEMPSNLPAADTVMNQKTVARRISAAMAELPERQRIAITLCHFEGMGNKEAAEVLNISVEALESLLARGRRALKSKLAGEKSHLMGEER